LKQLGDSILTINVPLILIVREIIFIFAGKIHNGAFRGISIRSGQFRGKVSAPSKNPKKGPIMCFAPDKKNNLLHFQNRGTLVFLCPKERERERGGKERARARKGKGKRKGKREGHRQKCGQLYF
jgi:hypothetical protein